MPKYLLSMFYNPNVKLKILAGLTLLDKETGERLLLLNIGRTF